MSPASEEPPVTLAVEHPRFPPSLATGLQRLMERALDELAPGHELAVAVVDEARMRELHRRFLGSEESTDVLSFGGEGSHLGDIVVCFDQAGRQSEELGVAVEEETARLALHGLLHLVGHDDGQPQARERLWAAQEDLLRRLWAEGESSLAAPPPEGPRS